MVTLVALDNQIHNMINVGLSLKQLKSEDKYCKVKFIKQSKVEDFWNSLDSYVDDRDKTLVILDIPHPDVKKFYRPNANVGDGVILYLASELNPLTIEERESLLNKGITVVPERKSYECFLGPISKENEKWINTAKVLTLKENAPDHDVAELAQSIITSVLLSPDQTVKKIAEGDSNYFIELQRKKQKHIINPEIISFNVCINLHGDVNKGLAAAVGYYIAKHPEPLVLFGNNIKGILTRNPTFYQEKVLGKKIEPYLKLGRASLFSFNKNTDDKEILVAAAKGQCSAYFVAIGKPSFMNSRTLQRR